MIMGAETQGSDVVASSAQSSPQSSAGGVFVPPRIGATLGRYQILSTLGHGAMATVFRARDTQLGRDVAIKVMGLAHAARGGAGERFRREAHAVAALKHAGIVEIYDFVDSTEETPSYIVAELISGPTLRHVLESRGGRLLPEIAALVAIPLAEALAVAHQRGVVHRDVKPDNVMIETVGGNARVVLTDFGVAHITGMETMTATGALVGSPAYMSPEQSRGNDVTAASDLWSLGAMLYEMVTGIVPFAGKDPFTMIAAILRGTFRRPSQVTATVGPEFEAIVLRCLKSTASERFADGNALAAELRAFTSAAGVDARSLREFLDDPDGLLAKIKPMVADKAVDLARQHARRGQLAKALAEIGHATAYVPNHAGADRLLRRLSASRAAIKAAVVLVGVAAAVGAVWLARPFLRKAPPVTPPAVVAPPALPVVAAPPVAPARTVPTETPASEPVASAKNHGGPQPVGKVVPQAKGRPVRKGAITAPEAPPAEETTTAAPVPEVAAPTPPPQPAPQPRPGTVALFAKGGFCYPSLDDQPAGDLMPVFHDVAPGRHKVYCSRTKQSAKELAGEIDLPPGGRIERTVTEHEGHLTIARPR
jgi:serine/threonine-protein kinase